MIRGKGKKERYVPFGDAVTSALAAYVPARQAILLRSRKNTPALLINTRGGRLTTRSVGRIIKKIAVAKGLSPDVQSENITNVHFTPLPHHSIKIPKNLSQLLY